MKTVISFCLLFVSANAVFAQTATTDHTKGIFIGVGGMANIGKKYTTGRDYNYSFTGDIQYRPLDHFSAGGGVTYQYDHIRGFTEGELKDIFYFGEVRYWFIPQSPVWIPYLFAQAGKGYFTESVQGTTSEKDSYFQAGTGAGLTAWVKPHWGFQVRSRLVSLRDENLLMLSEIQSSAQFGAVFRW